MSFRSYSKDALKKIPVNGITALFDDVITKICGETFTVKFLLKSLNELNIYKISSKQDIH